MPKKGMAETAKKMYFCILKNSTLLNNNGTYTSLICYYQTENLNCNIIPGTHPEQNILCSCDSLSGLKITKTQTGVKLNKNFDNYTIEKF